MKQKKGLPKLYPLNKDLKKTWFVQYTDENGRVKKLYGKLNHLHSVVEREAESKKLIEGIIPVEKEIVCKHFPVLYPIEKNLSRTWFVQYTNKDGCRKKIYGKLNQLRSLAEREEEARRIIKEINPKNVLGSKIILTVSNQLIKDLDTVFDMRKAGWKPKSLSSFTSQFNVFGRWFYANGSPIMDAGQANKFLNFLTDKKISNTTRNTYRRNLKSLFKDLKTFFKNRYIDNPFAEVRKLQEARKTKEWFRPSQIQKISKILFEKDPQLLLACKMMFHCFIRPNELRQLIVSDINFETKKVCVESSIAKTSRTRFVNIPAELINDLEYIKSFPDNYFIFGLHEAPGKEMTNRDSLSKRHKKILKELGFSNGYSFYSWKNTGAVKMLMMDRKPMRYVSKCMGHHSLDMTDKYFQSLGVDEMEDVIIFPSLNLNDKKETSNALLLVCSFQILKFS